MRKRACALVLFACLSVLAVACGGSDDSTTQAEGEAPLVAVPDQPTDVLQKAALVKAADANCAYGNERESVIGVDAVGPESAARLYPVLGDIEAEIQDLQEGLKPAKNVAADWNAYLKASAKIAEADRQLGSEAEKLAKTNPGEPLPADFRDGLSEAFGATYGPADALGLKVCTYSPDSEAPGSDTGPPADLDYPKPKGTLDAAAKAYLDAIGTGDCAKLSALEHSDNGPVEEPICSNLKNGYGKVRVIGTESYGPAGAVELFDNDSNVGLTVLMVRDTDGKLKHASDKSVLGGGLRPPNPGYDAQESMDAAIAAIRDGDATELEKHLGDDSSIQVKDGFKELTDSPTGTEIVTALREDEDAEPTLIGANQAFAAFLIKAGGRDWVLANDHLAGSETEYGGFSWWPID